MNALIRLHRLNGFLTEFGSALRKRIRIESLKDQDYSASDVQYHNMFLGKKQIGALDTFNGRVENVQINPQFRNMGLGKKLYGEVMKNSPHQSLSSGSSTSSSARRVWESMKKRPRSYRIVGGEGSHGDLGYFAHLRRSGRVQ